MLRLVILLALAAVVNSLTVTCNEGEEFVECPNFDPECRPETCDELGFPLVCEKYWHDTPEKSNITCGKARCMCKIGYVKDKSGKCVASTTCPSCAGDPNKQSGCGSYCTNCRNYGEEEVAPCLTACTLNSCECRPNYIYDPITENCTLPENCIVCNEDEEFVDCPNLDSDCRPETCDDLGFPLECENTPEKSNIACAKARCMCKNGYVKDRSGKCVATTSCPKP